MGSLSDDLAAEILSTVGIAPEQAARLAAEALAGWTYKPSTGMQFVPLPDQPPEITEDTALPAAKQYLGALPGYPERGFGGRGIVICAGGLRLLKCAWICIRMLQLHRCSLPIEVWHLGASEMPPAMRELLAGVGVRCIDGNQIREQHPTRTLKGWELKPYAIRHTGFEEVLLLDADNVPVANPEYLFEHREYFDKGAIFWPDEQHVGPSHPLWMRFGIKGPVEPEFETGQIIISKPRCWLALNLTVHFNEHSDFYYRHFHGDTGTFHLAWRYLGQKFAMTGHCMQRLRGVMCQHDFNGSRIFQHRHGPKWDCPDLSIPGFLFEDECRAFCREAEHCLRPGQ